MPRRYESLQLLEEPVPTRGEKNLVPLFGFSKWRKGLLESLIWTEKSRWTQQRWSFTKSYLWHKIGSGFLPRRKAKETWANPSSPVAASWEVGEEQRTQRRPTRVPPAFLSKWLFMPRLEGALRPAADSWKRWVLTGRAVIIPEKHSKLCYKLAPPERGPLVLKSFQSTQLNMWLL